MMVLVLGVLPVILIVCVIGALCLFTRDEPVRRAPAGPSVVIIEENRPRELSLTATGEVTTEK